MKKLKLSKEARTEAADRIQRYFAAELDVDIGPLPAEFVLEFFAEQIGGYFYNQGLADAQAVFSRSVDDVSEQLYAMEQRSESVR